MVTMSDWIEVAITLGSNKTKGELRRIILDNCLYSKVKFQGVWQVDDKLAYHYLIEEDPICQERADELQLENEVDIESWLEQIRYRAMRSTFPRHQRI